MSLSRDRFFTIAIIAIPIALLIAVSLSLWSEVSSAPLEDIQLEIAIGKIGLESGPRLSCSLLGGEDGFIICSDGEDMFVREFREAAPEWSR